jgi:hypothetical protein
MGSYGVGSMNMIRTLSIATFAGNVHTAGLLIASQLLGVLSAVVCAWLVDVNRVNAEEREVAGGEV